MRVLPSTSKVMNSMARPSRDDVRIASLVGEIHLIYGGAAAAAGDMRDIQGDVIAMGLGEL